MFFSLEYHRWLLPGEGIKKEHWYETAEDNCHEVKRLEKTSSNNELLPQLFITDLFIFFSVKCLVLFLVIFKELEH